MTVAPPTSLRRRVGFLTLGTSAVKSSQIVVAVLLVRFLSKADWSTVALALSVYLAALTLASLNLQQSLIFFLPLGDEGQHRSLVTRTALLLAMIGTAFAVVLVGIGWFAGGIGAMSITVLALVGTAVACELPTVCAPAMFVCRGRWGSGAGWDVTMTMVQVAAMVVPAATGHGTVAVLTGLAGASLLRLVGFVVLVGVFTRPGHRASTGMLASQLTYCIPLGFTMATGVLTRSVDKWLVAWCAPGELAVYVVAAQEIPVLSVLPYAGGAAVVVELVRRFSASAPRDAHELWSAQAATMSALVVPIAMFLVAAAPELFALFFPPSYSSGVFAFRCFTLITVHRVTEYGIVLRAANRTVMLVSSGVVLLVANAALGAVGAMVWGANGVAVGCLGAYAIGWVYMLRLLGGVFKVPWYRAFPFRPWFGALAISSAAAVLACTLAAPVRLMVVRLLLKLAVLALAVLVARVIVPTYEHDQRGQQRRVGAW